MAICIWMLGWFAPLSPPALKYLPLALLPASPASSSGCAISCCFWLVLFCCCLRLGRRAERRLLRLSG
jgi:hypothetical protein